jgi:ParB-like chromosome segregation protein Spo0J
VRDEGGEIWLCGPDAPRRELVGYIDRVLPADIVRSRTNPRTHFDAAYIKELAASIKARHPAADPGAAAAGQPPAGHVRDREAWRAAAHARDHLRRVPVPRRGPGRVDELPVLVRHLDDVQVLQMQLVENLKRRDLHPLEEAEGFERLINDHGMTIARHRRSRIDKSESYIYKLMKLLELTPECREQMYAGQAVAVDGAAGGARAGVPAGEIAKDIMQRADGFDDEPMSFRQAQRHIQQHYMLRWPTRCSTSRTPTWSPRRALRHVPKNTGANKDLFGDVDPAATRAPIRSASTRRRWRTSRRGQGRRSEGPEGDPGQGSQGDLAERAPGPRGYERLDSSQYVNGKYTTLRKALGKDAPTPC